MWVFCTNWWETQGKERGEGEGGILHKLVGNKGEGVEGDVGVLHQLAGNKREETRRKRWREVGAKGHERRQRKGEVGMKERETANAQRMRRGGQQGGMGKSRSSAD